MSRIARESSAPRTPAPPTPPPPSHNSVTDLLLQRMAGVVLNSGIGVIRGREDVGPRWANDAFLAMSGYARADLAGLDWGALGPAGPLLDRAPPGGITPTREHEFIRKDGSRWPVIISSGCDPTDPSQLILFVVDLTASRVAEAARHAADAGYARFFEVSNVAFWTADAQGRARLTSSTTADRLGSEVELDNFEAQSQLIYPDDRAAVIGTWRRSVAEGIAYDIEVRARGLDGGDYRWTRLQAFPDIVEGAVTGWFGTTEDVHDRRMAADALLESEGRFKRLADDIPVIVWLCDLDSNATYISKTWYDYTGQADGGALGRGWQAVLSPDDGDRMAKVIDAIAAGRPFDIDYRLRGKDGDYRWMMSSGRPRIDAAGNVIGFAGALTDIHARKIAEDSLADVQLRLSRALDGTGVGVWEWEAATDTVSVSGSALNISGVESAGDAYSLVDYRAAVHPEDRDRLLKTMADYVEGRIEDFALELRIRRRDRGWVWVLDRGLATVRDANGRATRMVGTLTNIDESKCAADRLRWTVDHDALTGLASRTLFHARLDEAMATGGEVALALLDIDNFKNVNDVLGHAAGDALLSILAERLTDFAYPYETVARLGGDEFTLIMPQCGTAAHVVQRLERLRTVLAGSFVHEGQTLTCRSSIGVAVAPEHGATSATLLRSADIAMYSAKAGPLGGVALYDPALGNQRRTDAAAVARVRAALDAGQVVPFYEPVVRLKDNAVVGYEALAQVIDGEPMLLDLHEFEASYGDAELSIRLGCCILDQALDDLAGWRAAGTAPDFIAVNATLAELRQGDYADRLLERLNGLGITPGMLRVEIVESGLHGPRAVESSAATIDRLRLGGLLAGIDKFGVGSSSLTHLAQLPLAAIKIDRELIQDVAEEGRAQIIVRAITGLGHSFGLRIVAVGVETAAQADAVTAIGCTYGQGPWFGMPVPASAAGARR